MDISGQWQFQSLYLCKTQPKCIGCRKQLDEQTFSHLPYLSDTLAKTDLFGKDIGQQTTDNGLLGGSRLFLRLRVNKTTRRAVADGFKTTSQRVNRTTSKVVAVLTFDLRLQTFANRSRSVNPQFRLNAKKLVVMLTCSLKSLQSKKGLWSFVLRLSTMKNSHSCGFVVFESQHFRLLSFDFRLKKKSSLTQFQFCWVKV